MASIMPYYNDSAIAHQVLADRCGVKRPTVNNLVEELIGLGFTGEATRREVRPVPLQTDRLQSHLGRSQEDALSARNGHWRD